MAKTETSGSEVAALLTTKQSEALLFDLEKEIGGLKQRIKLSESEERAEIEDRNERVEKNKVHIRKLKSEIGDLQLRMSKGQMGDEKILKKAFQKHSREMGVMKGKTGKDAVEILEGRVFDLTKKKDVLLHELKIKSKLLADLKQQYQEMNKKCNDSFESTPTESDAAQRARDLENEYEKLQMRIREAEHVQRMYKNVEQILAEDLRSLPNKLNVLESEYKLQQNDIDELISREEKACKARAKARSELEDVENKALQARQEKDKVVTEFNQVMDNKQMQMYDPEASRKRAIMFQPPSTQMEDELKKMKSEQEKDLEFYGEAFEKIKEATGVTDIRDAEGRFAGQNSIFENLQELKRRAEKNLKELKDEKKQLEREMETMRGAQLACPQVTLQLEVQKCKKSLEEQEKRKLAAQAEVERITQLLADAKTALWHQLQLMEYHLLEPEEAGCTPSDISVTELAEKVEQMLLQIVEKLKSQDVDSLKKQMKTEHQFLRKLEEEKMAEAVERTKAKPPAADEESSSDDEEIRKRSDLKKEAQSYADIKKKQKGRGKGLKL